MRRSRPKDFYTAVMFVLFGAGAMILSTDYQIGTAAKMGPGYFPFVLGALLAALGIGIFSGSLRREKEAQERPSLQFKPLLLVLSAVLLFSLLLRPLGLVASTGLLVVLAGAASHEFRLKETLLSAAVLVFVVFVVFVWFLEFQVPVWPAFLAGRT
jgi:hypothetical protein